MKLPKSKARKPLEFLDRPAKEKRLKFQMNFAEEVNIRVDKIGSLADQLISLREK